MMTLSAAQELSEVRYPPSRPPPGQPPACASTSQGAGTSMRGAGRSSSPEADAAACRKGACGSRTVSGTPVLSRAMPCTKTEYGTI
ncbi:hypothetical protein AAES_66044 [Amazona aestiva]|uniref:Uncharacterized protein n=1 Tax=Amazona aestiva TaxID=12930 RepID=A0A0Q3MK60_AMAAE|nr:hypothetical protein AAES_66044 [Amazona aestiva]